MVDFAKKIDRLACGPVDQIKGFIITEHIHLAI
jgi:hypothetical protein